jgi:tetratricopeptide (TPR) repeat protein
MQKRGWLLLLTLLLLMALSILAAVFWPWVSSWLPGSRLVEAWMEYLLTDLGTGRWGPVAILLLVAVVELIWALNLARRSDAHERYARRLDRLHAKEIEVLNHEIALLNDERRTLRSELELRGELIQEEKARLWSRHEDLHRASGLQSRIGIEAVGSQVEILRSRLVLDEGARKLPAGIQRDWQHVVSRLERLAAVGDLTGWKRRSALQVQQHADELLRLGTGCFQLGEVERALVHFDRVVELVPAYLEARINRAVVHLDAGRYQAALQDLEHAEDEGESPWVHLYRGVIGEQLGDVRRALEDYTRAIRLEEKMTEPYYRRGAVYLQVDEYDQSIADESRVLEQEPNHAGACRVRGIAWAALGDPRRALEDLNQACALAPDWSEAFYQRGLVQRQLAATHAAMADLDRTLELAPEHVPALLVRGDLQGELGDHWQAMADYDRAIELEPNSAAAHRARGRARAAVREYDRAIEDFTRAIELEPELAEALADLGAALEKKGDHSRAIQELDRALALDATLAAAYYARGLAYGSLGQYDRASRDLNKAVELDPSLERKERRFPGATSG